ncbi:hypothetical protein OSB04_004985 [Centaurea solstitialis]|uniref:Retrovirus-related Pol polyprotein from transposon TNT 1-94 n=1 Tax=Centaurea solstitialis TaxID=347529 RepID=A0AA38TRR9_9ASTR|nr:hypothetical protein OSB04_004985 [Centaurea solstitialis]
MDANGNPIVSAVMTTNTLVTSTPIVSIASGISSGGLPIVPMNHAEKPEKFFGLHFKRWQQKMFFYLTTLNLARYLSEDVPQVPEGQTDIHVVSAIEAWKHSDFLCRNYVLNGLVDALYNVYSASNTSKELWQSLEKKYKTEDAGSKKFVVARFLEFKMNDSKTVMSQVQELQVMLHDINAEGMIVSEPFQVAAIIEKLPPAWMDFKNYLKHKRKEMSVEDLVVRLRIEEDNKIAQKRSFGSNGAKANVVEHGQASRTNKTRCMKGREPKMARGYNMGPRGGIMKKRFQGNCYNCDKPGHRALNCRLPKREKTKQANFVDDIARDVSVLNLTAMISEVNLVGSNPREWWIDTGATRHVCSDKEMFHGFKTAEDGEKLFMGNSATADIKGSGKIVLKMTSGKDLTLNDVLYVPEIRKNLVSGWLLNKHGFRLVFESDKFVLTKMGVFVGKGYAVNGMFKLNVMAVKPSVNEINKSSAYLLESSYTWHDMCQTCVEAKLTRTSFRSIERSTNPLDMIDTDVCDMKSNPSRGGNKFFITFIDDCTKYCYVYLLKSKDEAIEKFVLYKNEVENQHNKRIKVLRSDRGGEYVSPFAEFCGNNGIRHEFTAPYSPQQNGIAERKNRTLKEMMNAMLLSSGLPPFMWGEAVLSANYILNKVPRKKLDKTPYELWMGRKPSYKYLRVWGCLAKVVAPPPKAVKIGPKTVDCIFIGYAQNSSAHRFLVHESSIPDIHKNTIMESRNASFFEDVFPCLNKEDASALRITPSERNEDHIEEKEEEEEIEPRRSKRARVEKTFGPDFYTYMVEREPQTFQEAVTSSEGPQWKEAIKSEMDSILQNHTWELVDLPAGCKPLGHRWIFKRKMKADGTIDKYKARLVIKGYNQREGLDYFDTYSPVTRLTSIRLVLAIASLRNLEVHQMDVKTAFLNGDLEEEIYMEQPEGYVAPGQERKVCKLVKSLYGLKQAPKQWHQKFDHVMLECGFKINECDKCVYVKDTEVGYVILCLYVDDMLIIGSNDKMVKSTKNMLKARFDMKDMGLANVILGIQISRTQNGLALSQAHYVDKILEKFNADDTAVARTPIDTSHHLSKNRGEGVAQVEYSRIIGSLMYLMSCTRPDLAFAVSRLSRYTSNPSSEHWKSIIRVLRYLRYTRDYGLHYSRYPAVIEGFSDANWISDIKDSKSTSGYVFTLGGASISWKLSKQTVIARSTMESEFIALDKCGEEAEWLKQFLEDIPRWEKPVSAICIHCDSQSAIGRAQSAMYNGKSRHIRRRHNTIRQLLSTGVISIDYVRSKDNIADPLTKGLNRELVSKTSRGMGLKPLNEHVNTKETQPS